MQTNVKRPQSATRINSQKAPAQVLRASASWSVISWPIRDMKKESSLLLASTRMCTETWHGLGSLKRETRQCILKIPL